MTSPYPLSRKLIDWSFLPSEPPAYAVFDADNTLWRHDLGEALLAYLEHRGILKLDALPDHLKIIPCEKYIGVYEYYLELVKINPSMAFIWNFQVFAGFSLGELKTMTDAVLDRKEPTPIRRKNDPPLLIDPPRFYSAMQKLVNELTKIGIAVYVITACSEEMVRMVVSDPQKGWNISPSRVIGLNFALKNPATNEVTVVRKTMSPDEPFPDNYRQFDYYDWVMTSNPAGLIPFSSGKLAAIKEFIHPEHRPILAAGDGLSDLYMLMNADVGRGGIRLFVDHSPERTAGVKKAIGLDPDRPEDVLQRKLSENGWLFVTPQTLFRDDLF